MVGWVGWLGSMEDFNWKMQMVCQFLCRPWLKRSRLGCLKCRMLYTCCMLLNYWVEHRIDPLHTHGELQFKFGCVSDRIGPPLPNFKWNLFNCIKNRPYHFLWVYIFFRTFLPFSIGFFGDETEMTSSPLRCPWMRSLLSNEGWWPWRTSIDLGWRRGEVLEGLEQGGKMGLGVTVWLL